MSLVPNNPPLSGWSVDPELVLAVEYRATSCSLGADRVLFRQGDVATHLFFVRAGEVELNMETAGTVVMRVYAGPGSLVGLSAVIAKRPYTMTATASQEAHLCELSADAFNLLIQENPRFSMDVLRIMAGEIHSAHQT
jgi:CBS domain-containing protein